MTVYIEYAFLQNFFLDGALVWLSLKGSKTPVKGRRIALSALVGGVFAVLYPLLGLTKWLGLTLKISVGVLLCMLAFGRLKGKREWGRFATFTLLFFALSFAFGGAISPLAEYFKKEWVKPLLTPICFVLLSAASLLLFQKLYKKRALWRHIYECEIISGKKSVLALGFLDCGNMATKNGVPVCFLSPERAYELWGEEWLFHEKQEGQVCDEMQIFTVAGVKKTALRKGDLHIRTDKGIEQRKEVYFAVSPNMIGKEYTLILHSRILG